MATTNEIEAKYAHITLTGPLPLDTTSTRIVQTYLNVPDGSDIERRVRKWTEGGKTTYFLTMKAPTGTKGERKETEVEIFWFWYILLVTFSRDMTCMPIIKMRHTFYLETQKYEYDVYGGHLTGLTTLEMETDSADKIGKLAPPSFMEGRKVTGDKRYSNRQLAEHGIPKAT